MENERLKQANKVLEEQMVMLERTASGGGTLSLSAAEIERLKSLADDRASFKPLVIPKSRFDDLDDRLDMVQQTIQPPSPR